MLQEMIARSLSLRPQYVARLAKTASYRYFTFTIPKANGGLREIHHPAKPLKAVQRWLNATIIDALPVHKAAAAYRPDLNIADHASKHVKNHFLLRVDLANFFESISANDIASYINHQPARFPAGWTIDDTILFTRLVCREGQLTIGAVTSPGLSNALCFPLDHQLTALSTEQEVTYTRYADDLFFSTSVPDLLGEFPKLVASVLTTLPYPTSLAINPTKTRHSSLKRRRRVTGIVLSTQGKISLGWRFKRSIRSQIHKMDGLDLAGRTRLAGLLAFVRDIEPAVFNRLVLKYGKKVAAASRPPRA